MESILPLYDISDLSGINSLPLELLCAIFAICTQREGLAPLKLRQVCRRWRDIADTSPLLWSTLTLDDDVWSVFSSRQIELWSRNAEPLKYDILLHVSLPSLFFPTLAPLLPFVARWRSFSFRDRPEEAIAMDQYDFHMKKLTHLIVNPCDWVGLRGRLIYCQSISFRDMGDSYALDVSLVFWPDLHLPRLRFVHLTIIEGGQNRLQASSVEILGFLASCPELESFFLSGFPHDEPEPARCPLVRLPNLLSLHLKRTCFVRILLSNLDTPRLENLILAELNTADTLLASGTPDEGASDDDADDFSQSPFSDLAAGMGLRTLLTRSSPPLRMLNMDFSDMRTKDFRYVFDRLPSLEDFVIAGSDMSDTVVNLLRPVPSSDAAVPPYVRLPHLRKLGLVQCMRMTGDTVVRTIEDRVAWTDLHTPSWTFVEVDVTGCSGIDAAHCLRLRQILGERLSRDPAMEG